MRTIALALLLAGCATQGPAVMSATPHSVTVDLSDSTMKGATGALEAAEAHCQQHGRHAQFAGKINAMQIAYNCV